VQDVCFFVPITSTPYLR